MGGGLESRCVGRVYGADGAVHGNIHTVHTLFHEEDAQSNTPQVIIEILEYQQRIFSVIVSGRGMHIDFVEDIQTG